MKRNRHMKRFGVVMAVALVAIGALAGAALATDASPAEVGGTLTAGPLNVDSITAVTLGNFDLTGRAGTLTATGASGTMLVTDARGSGAGWQVQAIRSAFSTTLAEPAVNHTLDGAMAIPTSVVTKNDAGSSTAPSPSAQTIGLTTPVTLASAAVDAGMGSYNLTFGATDHKITMGVTADDYAGAYSGTLTVSTISGPAL
jgi:hypothetical protein